MSKTMIHALKEWGKRAETGNSHSTWVSAIQRYRSQEANCLEDQSVGGASPKENTGAESAR